MGLLAKERKARWIGTGTWSDSGIDPDRLVTVPRVTGWPFYCSVRTSYGTDQIVSVSDLYYQWSTGGGSGCSGYVSCSCYGDCGSIGNTNCSPDNGCGIGCQCYHYVNANTTGGYQCNNGSDFYNAHGNCSMNACWGGSCTNGYDGWCSATNCADYCPCAWSYKACSCHTSEGYTNGSWTSDPVTWHCRNCPSDDNNDCHCNSGNG